MNLATVKHIISSLVKKRNTPIYKFFVMIGMGLKPMEIQIAKLDSFFMFMDKQMKQLDESRNKGKINSMLFDSDIEMID